MTDDELKARIKTEIQASYPEATEHEIGRAMVELEQIMFRFTRKIDERKAGFCPKCHHTYLSHGEEIVLGNETVYECIVNMGMGDWCGCKEKKNAKR